MHLVVKNLVLVLVRVPVKLGHHGRLEPINDLAKFAAEDGPTVGVSGRYVAQDVNLTVATSGTISTLGDKQLVNTAALFNLPSRWLALLVPRLV